MSWESTETYYRIINEQVTRKLGGLQYQHRGNWAATAELLSQAARHIELCGAHFLVICTNTMHKVAADIEGNISIPILHIADATAERIIEKGISSVGLLGTKFTMEHEFYKGRLADKYGLDVLIPGEDDRQIVHNTIYDELCLGRISKNSKAEYLRIITELAQAGAEAVILGCTEIALLVQQEDTHVELFDTTTIHAETAVEEALA